ncbi:MAG: tetratricopeptide repeat protein [Cyanobacteriota bacterium]
MIVTDIAPQKVSSWNRQTYQRLKLALSLGLRRQIFVAVCDDLSLRHRLASKLHNELGVNSANASTDLQGYAKLVSLELNLSDPNPLGQMGQWLAQDRQNRISTSALAFQILGVERLTRQPPSVQRLFLRRLQAIEHNLLRLESPLLLWLPRPWFHTIQQSVPEFWRWHTGIFEFEGEPTPPPPVGASRPESSPTAGIFEESPGSFQEDLRSLLAHDLSDVEPRSAADIRWKKQQQHNRPRQQPIAPGTPTGKNSAPSSPKTSVPKAVPFPTSGSQKIVPFAKQDAIAPPKPKEQGISRPIKPQAAPPPQGDFNLGDLEQEIETLQFDELVSSPQPPLPSAKSSEPAQTALPTSQPQQPPASSPTSEPTSQPAESPAQTYLELGHYYRHAIEQGDASEENLMIAIQAYEQALHLLDKSSPQASDILNDLGNLYWMLSRCPSSGQKPLPYIEQAIQSYQLALTKLIAEEAPQTYAMIQNNLGAAYGDLARHKDPAESLAQSVRAYEEALRYRRADNEPLRYASTQNNLGTAYWNLAQHQAPVPSLRSAIAAYEEALSYYSAQSEPLNWAMIQNNLGTAYWNLAQYEQPEIWLDMATYAYQQALKYRTPEDSPAACASTYNNLGTAFWHLADRSGNDPQQQAEYLEECVAAYDKALALSQQLSQQDPPITVNFDVRSTNNNLGLAHYQLATEVQSSLNKEAKLAHLEAALEQHGKACMGIDAQSDAYKTALSYIIKTIRAIYELGGTNGQNRALSKVPGQLLPEILPRL